MVPSEASSLSLFDRRLLESCWVMGREKFTLTSSDTSESAMSSFVVEGLRYLWWVSDILSVGSPGVAFRSLDRLD